MSIQRIYNLKSENRGRFQQIVQADKETLQVLKRETSNDLWIVKASARMAGFQRDRDGCALSAWGRSAAFMLCSAPARNVLRFGTVGTIYFFHFSLVAAAVVPA